MISFTRDAARATAVAATLIGAIVIASPVFAASDSARSASSSEQAMAATGSESPANSAIEARIKELHKRLHITEAQKPQWDALTQVMRDNAQAMVDLEKQRAANVKTMNAVEVVKSYAQVIDAHEDGMKKFIPAFEALYNSMSDEQKKIADSMFRTRARSEAKKVASEGR
jgi:hypothetical protein